MALLKKYITFLLLGGGIFLWPLTIDVKAEGTVDAVTALEAAVEEEDFREVDDPFESFNRCVFEFNMAMDMLLFRPLAELYGEAVPDPIRDGVHNVVTNLSSPLTFVNDILQFEGDRAIETFGRFLINSTIGLGGLIDVATEMGIGYHSEDFGQTMGVAGVAPGPYLMLPLLGPSNPRDLIGRIADIFIDPVNIVAHANDLDYALYIRTGVDLLDRRTNSREFTDKIERESLDPYVRYRSLYMQNRHFLAHNQDNFYQGQDLPKPSGQ